MIIYKICVQLITFWCLKIDVELLETDPKLIINYEDIV